MVVALGLALTLTLSLGEREWRWSGLWGRGRPARPGELTLGMVV